MHAWGWAYGVPQTSQGGGLAALAPARAKPDMATRGRPCSGRAGSATGGLANQGACSGSAYASAYASRIARTGVCIAYARMCPTDYFRTLTPYKMDIAVCNMLYNFLVRLTARRPRVNVF